MDSTQIKQDILRGRTFLGIELGSTRIKAVLINEQHLPLSSGSFDWENRLEDGIWTYHYDEIWAGLRACYADLAQNVQKTYGIELTTVGAMGVSAMMHGYMPFDKNGELLVPFRTWRNTTTGRAAQALTDLFSFNIPQRWSIAHLYQAVLNGESHLPEIDFLTTLAGCVHWKLTGEKVIGIGDGSGMFPIDSATSTYDETMSRAFDALMADKGYPWHLLDILPKVLPAGANAGALTEEGARLLNPSGKLTAGIPFCPPEGDAGTGMVATNSVKIRTGNVSAGTSVFAMVVMDEPLSRVHPEIDLVTTPSGAPVAMVHCNNCTSDLNAWVSLFGQVLSCFGCSPTTEELYGTLYRKALEGAADCDSLMAYNYFSGEHVTGFEQGRPLFVRRPESDFTLANFMRTHLYTSLGALKTGLDILMKQEGVTLDSVTGHGGLFKTPGVGQRILAAAMNTPVTCMETAGEGGPWGMAVLAAYMMKSAENPSLEEYLAKHVFACCQSTTVSPEQADVDGFNAFMQRYAKGLSVEKAAVDCL